MPDSVDFSRKPVLVLGASGFIGSRVVAALARHPLYVPVAASRRSAVKVDATRMDSVLTALRGMDCVINCIAGDDRQMVRSTQVLCDAARTAPPRRIIQLSSMAVYGAATGTVTEDRPPAEPVSGYGRAKIACEAIVQKYVADGGDAVILRPTCVFGPGSPQWTERLVTLLRARRIGDLGVAGDGRCNLAFIDDLVGAVITALDAPDVSGMTFNVSSSSDLSWNEFLVSFAKALGATPVRRVPARLLRIETKLLAPVRKIAGKALRSPATEAITPSLAALWRQDIRVDFSAAEDRLSLRPTSAQRMIAAVVQTEQKSREPALS